MKHVHEPGPLQTAIRGFLNSINAFTKLSITFRDISVPSSLKAEIDILSFVWKKPSIDVAEIIDVISSAVEFSFARENCEFYIFVFIKLPQRHWNFLECIDVYVVVLLWTIKRYSSVLLFYPNWDCGIEPTLGD